MRISYTDAHGKYYLRVIPGLGWSWDFEDEATVFDNKAWATLMLGLVMMADNAGNAKRMQIEEN